MSLDLGLDKYGRWCDLPELAVKVEPDWWCRPWRI
jgi:hypothetical protein